MDRRRFSRRLDGSSINARKAQATSRGSTKEQAGCLVHIRECNCPLILSTKFVASKLCLAQRIHRRSRERPSTSRIGRSSFGIDGELPSRDPSGERYFSYRR